MTKAPVTSAHIGAANRYYEQQRTGEHAPLSALLAEFEKRGYQRCQADVAAGLRSEADGHRGHDDNLAGACNDFASAVELGAYVGASERCAHAWQETCGDVDEDFVASHQRCTKCGAEQTIEMPRGR